MVRLIVVIAVIAVCAMSLSAQHTASIHELESRLYDTAVVRPDAGLRRQAHPPLWTAAQKPLSKHIFGWYPYWMGTAYTTFDYSLLTTVAYFSYEVDTATGSYTTVRSWKTTDLVPLAHAQGTKVVLTVTNFGNAANTAVLRSPGRRRTLVDSLVALVKERGADGVNIDFEGITDPTLRDSLTTFLRTLADRFHTDIPGSQVSIALPAVDWSGVFDVRAYDILDYCILMGYDYHWSTSPLAGPVAPLDSSERWGTYSVLRSVRTYLAAGLPPDRLLLGVPYYGLDWPTASYDIPAPTTARATARTYAAAVEYGAVYGRRWDDASSTPYYLNTDSMRQGWYDDVQSLALKYDAVQRMGLGGVGIWALGYDGARPELWSLLRERFTVTASVEEGKERGGTVALVDDGGRPAVLCRLAAPCVVSLDVCDLPGRIVLSRDYGAQSAGTVVLRPELPEVSGPLFLRVRMGDVVETVVQRNYP